MDISVLTIFPDLFQHFWAHGIIRRAIDRRQISTTTVNIRDFAEGKHRVTDDRPYGGGNGMVMKPEPVAAAIRNAKKASPAAVTILMTPQGRPFNQEMARRLALTEGLIFVCGRYEGVDERISEAFIDFEVSIGDYVLTGGELPAMIVIEAVTRLIPGVLGGADSAALDTFEDNLVEHAHYTRPCEFEGRRVPDVLLSGDHQAIARWRAETSLIRTLLKREDLLSSKTLSREEIGILKKWCAAVERVVRSQTVLGPDPSPGGE